MAEVKLAPKVKKKVEQEKLYTIPELHAMAGGFPFTVVKAKVAHVEDCKKLFEVGQAVTITGFDNYRRHFEAENKHYLASDNQRIWAIHRPFDWGKMI